MKRRNYLFDAFPLLCWLQEEFGYEMIDIDQDSLGEMKPTPFLFDHLTHYFIGHPHLPSHWIEISSPASSEEKLNHWFCFGNRF
jgi:hypothetical protein